MNRSRHTPRQESNPTSRRRSLRLEPLEDRRVLATVTVTTPLDVVDIPDTAMVADLPGADGVVSLREASIALNNTDQNTPVPQNTVLFDADVFASPTTVVLNQGLITFNDVLYLEGVGSSLTAIDLNQSGIEFPVGYISGLEIFNGTMALTATGRGAGGYVSLNDVHLHSNEIGVRTKVAEIQDSVLEGNDIAVEYRLGFCFECGFGILALDLTAANSTLSQNGQIASGSTDQVTLVDSVVTENGSGMSANRLTLTRTEFSKNDGGLIGTSTDPNLNISTSTITDNRGGISGGGAISQSVISNNAGGIDNIGGLTMTDSVFSGNARGIETQWGDFALERSAVAGNGGGVAMFRGSIIDSTISHNRGGGVKLSHAFGTNVVVQRSTISGNTGGGIIHNPDSTNDVLFPEIEISHSIVAGNGGFDTSAIGPGAESNFVSTGYNILGFHEGSAGSFTLLPTDRLGQADPGLAVAADNGGNTLTQALLASSPALDASVPGLGLVDQRGFPRFVDGDGNGVAEADSGAFESDGTVPSFYLAEVNVGISAAVDQPLSLSANAVSAAGGLSYRWEFSDGVTLTGASASRSFTEADLRQPGFDHGRVELIVTDANGNELSTPRAFKVTSDPPTFSLVSAEVIPEQGQIEVVVAYVDDLGIDESSIDDSDISIFGPGDFSLTDLTTETLASGQSQTLATYHASTGSFSTGDYDIVLNVNAVKDTQSNYVNDGESAVLTTLAIDVPQANATAPDILDVETGAIQITVVFSDDVAIDGSSILNSGVLHVTPLAGSPPPIATTLVSLDNATSGTPITATYEALPVGATQWTSANNGGYNISVTGVTDTSGNPVQGDVIGAFLVGIVAPDPPGLTASVTAADLLESSSAAHPFSVVFEADAVNNASLEEDNFEVVYPDGTTVIPTLLSIESVGATSVMHYELDPPDGAWADVDNGIYRIRLRPNEIFDIADQPFTAGEVGRFRVNVPFAVPPLVSVGGLLPGDFSPPTDLSHDVDLADLDGDGDLDAFLTIEGGGNQVYLNDGFGFFWQTFQSLEAGGASNENTIYADLGDIDGDGDIDALVTHGGAENELIVWLNGGDGAFVLGPKHATQSAIDVGLADIDSDGDLDVYVAQFSHHDLVFTNDGTGQFVNSGQAIGSGSPSASKSIEFGDLDSDGDLDAVVGVQNGPNLVLVNDGSGVYTVGPTFGSGTDQHVALGDVNGDGNLDAVASTTGVWLNTGDATFFELFGQLPGAIGATSHVALADVDEDGDLDAYVANWAEEEDWLVFNDGSGVFTGEPVRISVGTGIGTTSSHVAFGDLDNDGDPDALVALYQDDSYTLQWMNTLGGPNPVCDFVGEFGCDMADIGALYEGTNGAPTPLTDALIVDWLAQASWTSNPLKSDPSVVYVLGDVDLDGNVNSTDLGLLLNNFGDDTGLNWGDGNLNSDSVIDSTDLGLLLNNFNHSSGVAATVASLELTKGDSAVSKTGTDYPFVGPLPDRSHGNPAKSFSVRELVFGAMGDEEDDENSKRKHRRPRIARMRR